MTDRTPTAEPGPSGDASGPIETVVLAAAQQMLADGGVDKLTIQGVAARTGIAKTTLYRRWRSKKELALAVVLDMARTAAAAPPADSVRRALIDYLQTAINLLTETIMGRVMQGLASPLATDPELAAAFRVEVIALRRGHLEALLQAGVDRGEVRPDFDIDLVQALLFGPVYYRLLMSGHPLDPTLAERLVDAVLPALAPDAHRVDRPEGRSPRYEA